MNPPRSANSTELAILRYLDEHHPSTVVEVAHHMREVSGQARTTVLTILERLRAKGVVSRRKIKGVFHYSPKVPGQKRLQGLVRQFVERSLAGDLSPFVAYLCESASLSEEELSRLKQAIEALEQRQSSASKQEGGHVD
ncbi:MAG: BlaI/MecI/CopY family transcriptional regulator [Planctomycetales bacterium]|nr:BlaI/MecI/CopY family transcriptional regulator [Planctomycetales bacterium]